MTSNERDFKNITISPTVHRLLKVEAAKQGRPLKAVTDEALLEYLARRQARNYVKEATHDDLAT